MPPELTKAEDTAFGHQGKQLRFSLRILLVVTALIACCIAAIREHAMTRPLHWEPYSKERVEELLAAKKTVLVSVCGYWNYNSVVHEYVALNNPEMYRFVRQYNTVALRADYTNGDPNVKQLMDELGLLTIPAFVVYSPDRNLSPKILRDIVSEEQLRQVIAHSQVRDAAIARSQIDGRTAGFRGRRKVSGL